MNISNISGVVPEVPLVKYFIPQPLYYIIGTGLLFVFTFGSFMNFTGLLVFAKNKHMRSPTNTFIISLLMGDFGMSICSFISMTAHYNRFYLWGDNVCTFEGFWMYFMGLTNMYTIMGISFDRYIVIAKPLQASKITTRVAVAACLAIWFQGFAWAAFPFLGWGRYTYEAGRTSCSVQWDTDDIESASYNISIFIWSLFLPLMLIFYCYYNVFMTVSMKVIYSAEIYFLILKRYTLEKNLSLNIIKTVTYGGNHFETKLIVLKRRPNNMFSKLLEFRC